MLDGYKTYIFVAFLMLNNALEALGWMTPGTVETLNWIFGGGALAALRAGVAKS